MSFKWNRQVRMEPLVRGFLTSSALPIDPQEGEDLTCLTSVKSEFLSYTGLQLELSLYIWGKLRSVEGKPNGVASWNHRRMVHWRLHAARIYRNFTELTKNEISWQALHSSRRVGPTRPLIQTFWHCGLSISSGKVFWKIWEQQSRCEGHCSSSRTVCEYVCERHMLAHISGFLGYLWRTAHCHFHVPSRSPTLSTSDSISLDSPFWVPVSLLSCLRSTLCGSWSPDLSQSSYVGVPEMRW